MQKSKKKNVASVVAVLHNFRYRTEPYYATRNGTPSNFVITRRGNDTCVVTIFYSTSYSETPTMPPEQEPLDSNEETLPVLWQFSITVFAT